MTLYAGNKRCSGTSRVARPQGPVNRLSWPAEISVEPCLTVLAREGRTMERYHFSRLPRRCYSPARRSDKAASAVCR